MSIKRTKGLKILRNCFSNKYLLILIQIQKKAVYIIFRCRFKNNQMNCLGLDTREIEY